MSQAVMQEVNMDVFARRIAPYFSWLESRIESGWSQSEMVTKDVLRETKTLSTNMRARFILGVNRDDFVQEVQRALELFDLAADAFPDESDEIESKSESLVKGIAEELGPQFLPGQTSIVAEKPKISEKVESIEKPIVEKPVENIEKKPKVAKPEIKIDKPKIAKPAKKIEKVSKPLKVKPKVVKSKKPANPVIKSQPKKIKFRFNKFNKNLRNLPPVKWVREFIFGED